MFEIPDKIGNNMNPQVSSSSMGKFSLWTFFSFITSDKIAKDSKVSKELKPQCGVFSGVCSTRSVYAVKHVTWGVKWSLTRVVVVGERWDGPYWSVMLAVTCYNCQCQTADPRLSHYLEWRPLPSPSTRGRRCSCTVFPSPGSARELRTNSWSSSQSRDLPPAWQLWLCPGAPPVREGCETSRVSASLWTAALWSIASAAGILVCICKDVSGEEWLVCGNVSCHGNWAEGVEEVHWDHWEGGCVPAGLGWRPTEGRGGSLQLWGTTAGLRGQWPDTAGDRLGWAGPWWWHGHQGHALTSHLVTGIIVTRLSWAGGDSALTRPALHGAHSLSLSVPASCHCEEIRVTYAATFIWDQFCHVLQCRTGLTTAPVTANKKGIQRDVEKQSSSGRTCISP